MKGKESQNELISLNENLNTEFEIQQLEERLETDPLALSGLMGVTIPENSVACLTIECGSNFKIEF